MNRTALEIATTDRPLSSIGIDPSSELGAMLTGCRLRLYWLHRGYDVPVVVRLTVPPVASKTKARREPCYAAQLEMRLSRRINGGEAFAVRQAALDEIEALVAGLNAQRRVAA
jgi:hypothetical protein